MSNGIFENAWLQTSIATFQNAVLRDVNTNGLTQGVAIEKNKGLLKKNPYSYLNPEKVRSFEIGYRGMALKDRLIIDADIYFNNYSAFIAQVNMNVPASNNPDSIPYDLNNRNRQTPYRMWTNSTSSVYNYGYSLGLTYSLPGVFYMTSNMNYTKLTRKNNQDGLEDGFNTPEWMFNITLATNEIFKQFEAGATWRWQDGFYWQSFLVSGNVPSYNTIDAFLGYRLIKTPIKWKVGATNLLNHHYNSFLGGPSVGGFYYCSMSFGIN